MCLAGRQSLILRQRSASSSAAPPMEIPDAHCHLDQLRGRRGGLEGIGPTIAVVNDWSGYMVTSHLARRRKDIHVSLGLHPRLALVRDRDLPLVMDRIDAIHFVGEIGLDFSAKTGASSKRNQRIVFDAIMQACEDKDKVLNVHSTGAEPEVVEALQTYNLRSVVMHWYSGPSAPLGKAIQEGWYFSIPPAVAKSKAVQRVAREAPLNRLLIESDAPSGIGATQSLKGALERTAERLAVIRSMETPHLIAIVRENYARLTRPAKFSGSTQSTFDQL